LDRLKNHYGGTIADIFGRALKSLEAEMNSGVRKRTKEDIIDRLRKSAKAEMKRMNKKTD